MTKSDYLAPTAPRFCRAKLGTFLNGLFAASEHLCFRPDRASDTDLSLIDPQRKPTGRVMTGPDFERNVIPLGTVIRQGQENSFAAPLALWPLLTALHARSPLESHPAEKGFASSSVFSVC